MKNKNILISIAMCTYNGERFIKEQLESILAQSYKNIELIITDDGSTDGSIEIIEEYQKQDSRITLYKNSKRLGFIKNFEKAIGLCRGEYIALADQDDIWKSKKLEIFLEQIDNNLLIYSDAELIDRDSKPLGRTLITSSKKNLVRGRNSQAFLFDNCVSGNTLMFKRELVATILPIPLEFVSFHDTWIAFITSLQGTISYTHEPMTYYRRYDEQITNNKKVKYSSIIDRFRAKEQKMKDKANMSLARYSFFLTLPLVQGEIRVLLELLKNHYSSFDNGYFNFELYNYLKSNRDTIFKIKPKDKRVRYAKNISMRLSLHKLLLFTP